MALSDQLSNLAMRTKEAEDKTSAALKESREELEADIEVAREAARRDDAALSAKMQQMKDDVSGHWLEARMKWNHEVEKLHHDMEEKRADRDVKQAQKQAERMENDAGFAIQFAMAAVEEAERETLEAQLQRRYADDLAAAR